MQIGTPGSAYGPSRVMSRPTVGRAIQAIPRSGDVIGAALGRATVPGPRPFNPYVLHQELARRLTQARALRAGGGAAVPPGGGGMVVPSVQPGAVVGRPATPAFTVDPSALLARARLAALLQNGGGVQY